MERGILPIGANEGAIDGEVKKERHAFASGVAVKESIRFSVVKLIRKGLDLRYCPLALC